MANNRSFKEYIKHKLDNRFWAELEKYLFETDYSLLDLRLYRIKDIGEIELYNTEIETVSISDLPGSCIKFDVAINATLIVYDEDRYHNDESESTHQWFLLRCKGDLSCALNDTIISVEGVYWNRNKHTRPMSDALVPIIHKEQLEKEATEFLKKYYKEALVQPIWIDPIELARRMNLTVVRETITEDLSVFGQIYFRDNEATVFDTAENKYKNIAIEKGTILVDPMVAFQRNLGALNNTIVHECVHWDLHKKAFELESLYNNEASQIKCTVVGGVASNNNESTSWMEWQANALAPKIQMPLEMFKIKANDLIRTYRDKLGIFELCELMPFVIEELATYFMVSRTAAKIRMIEVGYEEAAGAFIYIDGRYIKPHSYKKGAIRPNQTYSISTIEAALQSAINPIFNSKVRDGSYIFVDSHFVLNHPRYLYQNENGLTLMTDYARYHIDECCLAFDLSIKNKVEDYYHTECFLNRDKGSPIDFNISFSGDLDEVQKVKLLSEILKADAEFLESLPNNFCKAMSACIEWRGITQKELAKVTGINEWTVGRILNGKQQATLVNVVLMSLGLHLPPTISHFLIEKSAHSLQYINHDHIWYDFALTHMYTKSVDEIRTFLQVNGAAVI